MNIDKEHAEQCWISLILRVAMAVLFGVAAFAKFKMGLGVSSAHIQGMFKDSWLPSALVALYAAVLPFAEALIAIWLLAGIKLRAAWVFTAFVLISLGFGLMAAQQSAGDVYVFVVMACLGIYFSRYDCCAMCCKK